jgi:hypothetical protein
VNWASLACAAGPETHGIFGFTRLDPATFAVSLVDIHLDRDPHPLRPALGARPDQQGPEPARLAPARPLRGMLVAGFPATAWPWRLSAALARLLAARG